jgi:hypothetical protein
MLNTVLDLVFLLILITVAIRTCLERNYSLRKSVFHLNIVIWYAVLLFFLQVFTHLHGPLFIVIMCVIGGSLGWYTENMYNYLFKEEDHVHGI